MKRFMIAFVLAVPLAWFISIGSVSGETEIKAPVLHGNTAVPDEELIKLYGDKMPDDVYLKMRCTKMAPVRFFHKNHVERGLARCGNCHHKDPAKIQACGECHLYESKEKDTPAYMDAHHNLCHPCHRFHKKGRSGPPIQCVRCHQKKNTEASGVACPKPKE